MQTTTTTQTTRMMEEQARQSQRQREDSATLWTGYVLAVLLGPLGLCFALYVATVESTARIRRHAIGIAGVSAISIAVSVLIYTSVILPGQQHL
jgi:hypothetical protein